MALGELTRAGAPSARDEAAHHDDGARIASGSALPPGMRAREIARRRRRMPAPQWTATLLLWAALGAALFSVHPLLRDLGWEAAGLATVGIVLGVAALVRTQTRSRLLPLLSAAAVATLTLTPVFAWGTGILGLVPNRATIAVYQDLVARGFGSIQNQSIPAVADAGILFLLVVGLAALALVADFLVLELRMPALAAIPLITLLSVTLLVQQGIYDAYAWVVTCALYLLLLRRNLRPLPPATVIAGAAVVVLGSLVVPFVLPAIVPANDVQGTGLNGRANPIIDLGKDLRRGAPVTVMSYTTKTGDTPYFRLATLSNFSGAQWEPTPVIGSAATRVSNIPAPQGQNAKVKTAAHRIDVSVGRVGGAWLPVPYPVTSVNGLTGNWYVEPTSLTIRSSDVGVDGQNYQLSWNETRPTVTQLKAVTRAVPAALAPFVVVPKGLSPVVVRDAEAVAGGKVSDYDKALALQTWFQTEFTYSERTPVVDGYDGSAINVLPEFLSKESGYCVHFASAMAVMARVLGIPSRIAVGYLPGEQEIGASAPKGESVYDVSSNDLHAWPELYFDGVGWVRFEPTPSRGSLPGYAAPKSTLDTTTPSDAPSASAAPSAAPSASASAKAAPDQNDPQNAATAGTGATPSGLIALGVLVAALLIALAPAGVRRGIRAYRLSRLESGEAGAPTALAELRDTARDFGWRAPPTETVRELIERLEIALLDDADSLRRLRSAVESEAYGRYRGAGVNADDLRRLIAAISRGASPRERARALLWPASLVSRAAGLVEA